MSVLFILVIASICVAVTFLGAFLWSVKSNQFADYKGASYRMLFDEDIKTVSNSLNNKIDE